MSRLAWLALAPLVLGGCFCQNEDEDPMPVNQGVGDPCMSSGNCRATLVCTSGTCQPAGTATEGQSCILTGDCESGLYCAPSRVCEAAGEGADGADCESTADCTPGLLCVVEGLGFRCRGSGQGDLDDACETDRECLAGLRCTAAGGGRSCQNPPAVSGDGGVGPSIPPALPLWPGETCAPDDGPPTAYFHVPRGDGTDRDFYRLPFPNDVRRTATGLDLSGHPTPGTTLAADVLGRILEAAEEDLDGFATNPVVYMRFSRDYEWADIDGDRLLLVDVDPSSPEHGRNLGRSWLTTAGQITRYICPQWLALRRGHGSPLRPGTTYAVILLRGVRTNEADGHREFARDADLDALLGESAPSDAALADAYAAYQPLREWLALDTSPGADEVLNAAVFTTQDPHRVASGLRTAVRSAAAPTLSDVTVCGDGVTSPCDDGELRRCGAPSDAYWEIHARIELPQFQQGTPPFEEPEDGGAITADAAGIPVVLRTEPVCMVMTVPKTASPPAGGFPVVFYAHGTGGAFTAPLGDGLAETFATGDPGGGAPQAVTVAIDMPLHGSRRGGSTRHPNNLVFNFLNPRAARDNFLQGAADLMSLVYWAESFVLPAASSPTGADVAFDATRLTLFAHSQGATHAQLMAQYEPALLAVVLSGAGGDLTESLLTKTRPVNIAAALPLALLDPDPRSGELAGGDHHPALAIIQMFFERVDPVNFGVLLHREPVADTGRHVFMTYGLGDSYSTERTMMAYARSAVLPHVEPQLVDIRAGALVAAPLTGNVTIGATAYTVGLRQYAPPAGVDGHFVSTQSPEGRADVTRFLLQALSGAAPAIGE